MPSFQAIFALCFALFACVLAQEYDATIYVTSTIYKVNTVTKSGTPTASVGNTTITISAYVPSSSVYTSVMTSASTPIYSVSANSSAPYPTAYPSGVKPSYVTSQLPGPSVFPGAASGLAVNGALVAAMAFGIGFFAL